MSNPQYAYKNPTSREIKAEACAISEFIPDGSNKDNLFKLNNQTSTPFDSNSKSTLSNFSAVDGSMTLMPIPSAKKKKKIKREKSVPI
jgi:hypothetical protein